MKLIDRITLQQFLLQQGRFEELLVIKSINKKIEITVDELEKFKIRSTEKGFLMMNQDGVDYNLDIGFSQLEKELIIKSLKNAKETSESLPMSFLDLYSQFIEE